MLAIEYARIDYNICHRKMFGHVSSVECLSVQYACVLRNVVAVANR